MDYIEQSRACQTVGKLTRTYCKRVTLKATWWFRDCTRLDTTDKRCMAEWSSLCAPSEHEVQIFVSIQQTAYLIIPIVPVKARLW